MTSGSLLKHASRSAIVSAVLAAASVATAQITIDFETDNPFSGGTLSSAQASSGTQSLFLDNGQTATFAISSLASAEVAKASQAGYGALRITMDVYDMGKWIDRSVDGYPGNVYGPRWGVSAPDANPETLSNGATPEPGTHTSRTTLGVTITERSFISSQTHYGVQGANKEQGRFSSSWFTLGTYAERQATLTPGTGGSWDGESWTPGEGGIGAWTTWTFEVALDGESIIQLDGFNPVVPGANFVTNIGDIPTEIWVYGGRNHATAGTHLSGVYLDNITIQAVPEPSTYALLFGAVALGAVAIRRRKTAKAA